MFHIKKEADGVFSLVGVIDDTANLTELSATHLAQAGPELRFNCEEVARINSIGIKKWCEVFGKLRASGRKLRFSRLPPCLVEQANYLSDFMSLAEIESFSLPFVCEKCGKSKLEHVRTEAASGLDPDAMELACGECGAKLTFDEVPGTYLAFLR